MYLPPGLVKEKTCAGRHGDLWRCLLGIGGLRFSSFDTHGSCGSSTCSLQSFRKAVMPTAAPNPAPESVQQLMTQQRLPRQSPHIAGKAQDRSLTETTTQQRRITRKSNRNSESRGQELVASSASRMTLVPTCCLTLEPSGLAEHQP